MRAHLRMLFLWIAAALVAVAGPDRIGLYLTWSGNPSTTMTVNWVDLYEEGGAALQFREEGAPTWTEATGTQGRAGPSILQVRRVELSGLKPDTRYEFRFEDKEGVRAEVFRTLPERHTRTIRFVAGGDMMHRREWIDAMNRRVGALDPDFVVMMGDLAYADGRKAGNWVNWLQSCDQNLRGPDGRILPMVVGIGNHEVRGGNDKTPAEAPYFYSLFKLPTGLSYYAFDAGDYLSFLILDSNHTQPSGGAQRAWLAGALQARQARPFLFVGYHYPIWGTAKRPKNGGLPSEHPRALRLKEDWAPLFERARVTAAFENDHHAYKRSHRILDGKRDDENGILYLGDGAWGVDVREVASTDEAWYLAHSEARRHVFLVTLPVQGEPQVEAVDADGTIFDRSPLRRR